MPPQFTILRLFSAPGGYLAEVKRLDQPDDAPKAKVYHWLWIEQRAVSTLQFIAMETSPRQQRTFEEAQLWFDDAQGELRWTDGNSVSLAVQADRVLPEPLHHRISEHLS